MVNITHPVIRLKIKWQGEKRNRGFYFGLAVS